MSELTSIKETIEEEFLEDARSRVFKGENRRQFIKVYDAFVSDMQTLTGQEVKVLLFLGSQMDYMKSRLVVNEEFWHTVQGKLNLSHDYARRILTSLTRKGFVYMADIYLYISSRYIAKRR